MTWTTKKLDEHFRQQIEQWTKSTLAIGKNELLSHFKGEPLTRQDAIKAQCYQCMNGYGDGEERDCQNPPCPLYPFHPYNRSRPKKEFSDQARKNLARGRATALRKPVN